MMEYTSPDVVEVWAEKAIDAYAAADILLDAVEECLWDDDRPIEVSTVLQAARLQLAEANSFAKTMLYEVELTRRMRR